MKSIMKLFITICVLTAPMMANAEPRRTLPNRSTAQFSTSHLSGDWVLTFHSIGGAQSYPPGIAVAVLGQVTFDKNGNGVANHTAYSNVHNTGLFGIPETSVQTILTLNLIDSSRGTGTLTMTNSLVFGTPMVFAFTLLKQGSSVNQILISAVSGDTGLWTAQGSLIRQQQ